MQAPRLIIKVKHPEFGTGWHVLDLSKDLDLTNPENTVDARLISMAKEIYEDMTGIQICRQYTFTPISRG